MTDTRLAQTTKKAIEKSGLTRAEFAELAGLSQRCLYEVLAGEPVTGVTLARLQRAGVVVADRRLIASLDRAA
jgi:predicted transcriptional regulator